MFFGGDPFEHFSHHGSRGGGGRRPTASNADTTKLYETLGVRICLDLIEWQQFIFEGAPQVGIALFLLVVRSTSHSVPISVCGFGHTLQVEKTADEKEIKKAYRKLAVKHHPDKGGDEHLFKEVSFATREFFFFFFLLKRKTRDSIPPIYLTNFPFQSFFWF